MSIRKHESVVKSMEKRNTIQRSLVLEAVNRLMCHATADEIYLAVAEKHPNISRTTVYRNLNVLSEMGKIRKIKVLGGADRFDHIYHNHCHVRCERCDRLFDVDMEYISGLEKNINNTNGFTFTGYDILFRGLCPDCQKADVSDKSSTK